MSIDIKAIRAEFERQHAGRNLTRHRLRGTYSSGPIAALWNQHLRSVEWACKERETTQPARDAARYRWLRDHHIGDDAEAINLTSVVPLGLDAAIDAAKIKEVAK